MMRIPQPSKRFSSQKHGVAAVEAALVLSVLVILILGVIEMSLLTLRHNNLSASARRLARQAAIHGEQSSANLTVWGPSTIAGAADEPDEPSTILRDYLIAMAPEDVELELEWLDDANSVGQRVRVTLRHEHQPLIGRLLQWDPIEMEAASIVRIEH